MVETITETSNLIDLIINTKYDGSRLEEWLELMEVGNMFPAYLIAYANFMENGKFLKGEGWDISSLGYMSPELKFEEIDISNVEEVLKNYNIKDSAAAEGVVEKLISLTSRIGDFYDHPFEPTLEILKSVHEVEYSKKDIILCKASSITGMLQSKYKDLRLVEFFNLIGRLNHENMLCYMEKMEHLISIDEGNDKAEEGKKYIVPQVVDAVIPILNSTLPKKKGEGTGALEYINLLVDKTVKLIEKNNIYQKIEEEEISYDAFFSDLETIGSNEGKIECKESKVTADDIMRTIENKDSKQSFKDLFREYGPMYRTEVSGIGSKFKIQTYWGDPDCPYRVDLKFPSGSVPNKLKDSVLEFLNGAKPRDNNNRDNMYYSKTIRTIKRH